MNRKEMIEKLESYKMDNGYYDVEAIIADEKPDADSLELTFAAFFGDGDEDTEATDSELVTLARELNEQIGQEKDREVETEITELVSELKTAQVADRNRIYNRLAELGAGQIIGDSDSLEFIWNEPYGGQYDDQTGIEESGGLPSGDLPAWGGHRFGAGRKPRTDGRESRFIRVAVTDEEYQFILDQTTPDTRRTALMHDLHVS